MSVVSRALWNPIIAKEFRSRMRTWRSPVAMTVYILLIGGLGGAVFSAMTFSARNSYGGGQSANYGQGIVTYLVIFQLGLLPFITPALTADTLTRDLQHHTTDLPLVTRHPRLRHAVLARPASTSRPRKRARAQSLLSYRLAMWQPGAASLP